ncbi:MAG: bifunctional phosphopantothenoylcysteine decarboxylase/phosphopantothenate--cysteine ligase CoaBC [Thermoplasmata archaeon]|nr:bifunctional phosphopantothenoylcysteine decarboxylase/phosphopantothenate--cysteine ligase CoaBC [Thermoplasmata archaeon]
MHPSRAIRGRTTRLLEGKRIVFGISGSIAAVEVPRIIRELLRHGAEVQAVMSPEATRIITPEAVEFATGHAPVLQLTGNVEHVTLLGPGEGQSALLLIAPATANTISKIAHGIDDTVVTSCASVALGGGVPILLAPAMHSHMGMNPAVRENIDRLRSWGVGIIAGASAEGEEKIASPDEVAAAVLHRLAEGPWAGRRVLVIGGASRERIDPVRSVTNESSGAMAVALATQSYYRGADVALWAGALQVPVPSWISVVRWQGVEDLLALARRHRSELARSAAVFVPAALSDFTLESRPGKIPSRDHPLLTLALHRAPKVLPTLRGWTPPPARLIGFKLETGATAANLEREGQRLRVETGADWVVANDVSSMGSSEASVLVLGPGGPGQWIRGPKSDVAGKLLDDLGRELGNIAHPSASSPVRSAGVSTRGPPPRRRAGGGARRRRPRRP